MVGQKRVSKMAIKDQKMERRWLKLALSISLFLVRRVFSERLGFFRRESP
jgi:hypothetical protein